MDTTLVTVTVLSMGMAAALSAIVWRMLRLERQRSNARISALTAMAAREAPAAHAGAAEIDLPIRGIPASATGDRAAQARSMFVEPERSSPWGARLAVMACVALVGASAVLFVLASRARHTAPRPTPAAPAGAKPASTNATAASGLELLSLRDARQSGSLTISGLVQNPRDGSTLTRVTVTAYTFDEKGVFLASGRALIDVTSLPPGDESPFVVTVPVTETVARYRIGFRDENGRVIAHVDRRQQEPMAALRPGSGLVNW